MVNEIISLALRANLALAAGVLLALVLRAPVRRLCGARIGYALWLVPVVAAAMCFLPARVVHIVLDAPLHGVTPTHAVQPSFDWVVWAWAGGALVSLAILALRQLRFTRALGRLRVRDDLGARVRAAESTAHGPAVIGVLRPIIVTPSDFEARFDAEEQRIVLAHERAHLAHGDPWINAIVLLLQCVNWFNPFVHLGARALRIDQELACDAAVLAQAEGVRRRYAEAMLKTHVGVAVPIGCAWPSSNLASFKERIAMLKRTLPSRTQRLLGVAAIVAVVGAAAAAAWAAQPARVVPTFLQQETSTRPLPPDGYTSRYVPISADDDELAGGDEYSVDGANVQNWEDLTPEQQDRVREAIDEARQQMQDAREQIQSALREANENQESRVALIESAREAADEAQRDLEETRVERIRAVVEARNSVREAQAEMAAAQAQLAQMPEIRAALMQARAEIDQAAAEARASGDMARLNALTRAGDALDAADLDDQADAEDDSDSED